MTGTNLKNQLGLPDVSQLTSPVSVPEIKKVIAVDGGSYHTMALTGSASNGHVALTPVIAASGNVYGWGWAESGRQGRNNEKSCATPCVVHPLSGIGVSNISCGMEHTAALLGKKLSL